MKYNTNFADVTDRYGAELTASIIPGYDIRQPQLVLIAVNDGGRTSEIVLDHEQASSLIKSLTDAVG